MGGSIFGGSGIVGLLLLMLLCVEACLGGAERVCALCDDLSDALVVRPAFTSAVF